jgi:hypothetical protein
MKVVGGGGVLSHGWGGGVVYIQDTRLHTRPDTQDMRTQALTLILILFPFYVSCTGTVNFVFPTLVCFPVRTHPSGVGKKNLFHDYGFKFNDRRPEYRDYNFLLNDWCLSLIIIVLCLLELFG